MLPYQMPQHLHYPLPELLPIPSLWPSTVQPHEEHGVSSAAPGKRDMGLVGTFYLLGHQWFSPASPQTSLQTPPGSQPVRSTVGKG